jgi:hypothetical protein
MIPVRVSAAKSLRNATGGDSFEPIRLAETHPETGFQATCKPVYFGKTRLNVVRALKRAVFLAA